MLWLACLLLNFLMRSELLSPALVKMVFFVLAILKRLLTRISTLKRSSMVQSPLMIL